jgi:dihydroorotate dehydrogenase (fumarate)
METIIAGITFPNPFFNASGVCCSTKEELAILRDTGAGGIWTKTTTLEPREGNPFPRVFCLGSTQFISGNSVGLANCGCSKMNELIKELNASQPVVLSIGGSDLFDIVQMVELSKDNPNIAAIEINPSCPNLKDTSNILAFDFNSLRGLLKYIQLTGITKPVGLKLPYYQNPNDFKQIASIIADTTPLIKFITCLNGMPGILFDPETNDTRTRNNDGLTGMGGDLLLPFALGNIVRFYKLFKELNLEVDIIGCGGVTCPEAAWQMIWAGAKGVQIGTRLLAECSESKSNLTMFWNDMALGLYKLMDKYGGFTSITKAIGGYHTMHHIISDDNVSVSPEVTHETNEAPLIVSNNYANILAMKIDERSNEVTK